MGGVDSETVIYLYEITKANPKVLKLGAWRGDDTRGHAVAFLNPYRDRLATVRVDADGLVELVHVGVPVESKRAARRTIGRARSRSSVTR